MNASTPGPWKAEYVHWHVVIRGPTGLVVASFQRDGTREPERLKADALLMAAAPRLVEALKGLLRREQECGTEMPWDGRLGPDPRIEAYAALKDAGVKP